MLFTIDLNRESIERRVTLSGTDISADNMFAWWLRQASEDERKDRAATMLNERYWGEMCNLTKPQFKKQWGLGKTWPEGITFQPKGDARKTVYEQFRDGASILI